MFIWPAILGELVNSFASFALAVTLFLIFCDSRLPRELMINTVSMNFIGAIDSEFTSDELRDEAISTFHHVMGAQCKEGKCPVESRCRASSEMALYCLCVTMRIGGTVILGSALGLTFFISHLDVLCAKTQFLCIE